MEPSPFPSGPVNSPGSIAILGAGPAGLVLAIALARRGLSATVIERDVPPDDAPRFNPDRSYTIDISGHGLKALRHIDAIAEFDRRMFRFKGLKIPGRGTEEWTRPGWTGSRGDILRALMAVLGHYEDRVALEFASNVEGMDPFTGSLTSRQRSGESMARSFDLIVGADGAGSTVRSALQTRVPGFAVTSKSFPNDCTMAAFAGRKCHHIGRSLSCSQLQGGKAVLIGDAAAPYPAIGQGVNGAMESAMVLDLCIGHAGTSPAQLVQAAARYSARWKPEADAVSWISERSLFENRFHTVRALATSMLGLSIFEQAKSADVPCSQVRRRAERLWALWTR